MFLAAIQHIPLESFFVPKIFEKILNKKIASVALNCFEKAIHWICSHFYPPYIRLYRQKAARIHDFSDRKTHLIDATEKGQFKVGRNKSIDHILLNGRKVFFSHDPKLKILFSKKAKTDYVLVTDNRSRNGLWYELIVEELPGAQGIKPMHKSWHLNAQNLHQLPETSAPGYLVEQSLS